MKVDKKKMKMELVFKSDGAIKRQLKQQFRGVDKKGQILEA